MLSVDTFAMYVHAHTPADAHVHAQCCFETCFQDTHTHTHTPYVCMNACFRLGTPCARRLLKPVSALLLRRKNVVLKR